MNNALEIISCLFSAIIALAFPIYAFFYGAKKMKGYGKSFLWGVWTFVIMQILIRIPIINLLLPKIPFFQLMPTNYPFLYSLFLGVTASLFEEFGRLITMKFFMKNRRTFNDAVYFGLGHGGIEAIIFLGLNAVTLLVGGYIGTGTIAILPMFLGGIERALAILMHISWSIMIMAFVNNKNYLYLIIPLLTHAIIDTLVSYLSLNSVNLLIIEGVILLFTAALFYYSITLKNKFVGESKNEKEKPNDNIS